MGGPAYYFKDKHKLFLLLRPMIDQLSPTIYDAAQMFIRGKRFESIFIKNFLKIHPGMRVLDLGCGTGWLYPLVKRLNCQYKGIDVCEKRIQKCKERFGDPKAFQTAKVGNPENLSDNAYDIVVAFGLLHHLDDKEGMLLADQASEALGKSGRFLTIDGVLLEKQKILRRLILQMDRGKFIRNQQQYEKILSKRFKKFNSYIEKNLFLLPYDLFIYEAFVEK